jgi:alkaline phosphatase D
MGKLTHKKKRRGLSRRAFLQHAGLSAALLPLLPGCGSSEPLESGTATVFQHGVATGDPLGDRIVFWTRITTTEASVPVTLRVCADPQLQQTIAVGTATTSGARDHTVKIDQAGLQPGTTYYYQFEALGMRSPVGRTRTAPAGAAARLRFGLVSCSSYAHGYFNAYRFVGQRADLDAIIHLGDYVYEYASAGGSPPGEEIYGTARPYEPTHEMKTLADYRTRHGYYKRTDPDLQELHRQFPMIAIWDDHESTDNSWRDGAANHNEDPARPEGEWAQRKAWAQQAYDEWMPIRLPTADPNRIWRRYAFGDLVDLFLLDTRLYDRDVQLSTPIAPGDPARNDPARRMLGPEQRQWLTDGLASSTATWKLIGNQVVFHQWIAQAGLKSAGGPTGLNGDAWDAYCHERQLIVDALRAGPVDNAVLLTGDVHSTWIADITDDPNNPDAYDGATGAGSVATEFVVTSITSPPAEPVALAAPAAPAFQELNPHIKYIEAASKGYMVLDVTPARVLGEVYFVSTIDERGGTETFATAFPVDAGTNRLGAAVTMPSTAPPSPPPFAP